MPKKRYALIVAGGSGKRMGSNLPKQFLPVMGIPILMHTVNAFYRVKPLPEIFIVLPEAEFIRWKNLCAEHKFILPHTLVTGGETRFHSVKNGLNAIEDEGLVAIHDGVRPFVSERVIENCYGLAEKMGNAIPAVNPVETVRSGSLEKSAKENRNRTWLVQTPQVFDLATIKRCYQISYSPEFTDDASVAEASGEQIFLVEGNRENIKITTPTDILLAEVLLKQGFLKKQ